MLLSSGPPIARAGSEGTRSNIGRGVGPAMEASTASPPSIPSRQTGQLHITRAHNIVKTAAGAMRWAAWQLHLSSNLSYLACAICTSSSLFRICSELVVLTASMVFRRPEHWNSKELRLALCRQQLLLYLLY